MPEQNIVILSDLWLKMITKPFVTLEKHYPPRGCPFEGNLLHRYTMLTLSFNGFILELYGGWIKYGSKDFGLTIQHSAYKYSRSQQLTDQEANELAGIALTNDYGQEEESKLELLLSELMK